MLFILDVITIFKNFLENKFFLRSTQVIWRHEGRLLTKNDKHSTYSEDGLIIPSITLDDRGKYYCLAANNAGSDKKVTTLKVHGLKLHYIFSKVFTRTNFQCKYESEV